MPLSMPVLEGDTPDGDEYNARGCLGLCVIGVGRDPSERVPIGVAEVLAAISSLNKRRRRAKRLPPDPRRTAWRQQESVPVGFTSNNTEMAWPM